MMWFWVGFAVLVVAVTLTAVVVQVERVKRRRARAAAEAAAWAEFRRANPELARLTAGFQQLAEILGREMIPVLTRTMAVMNRFGATLLADPEFRAYAEAHRDDDDEGGAR